MPCQPSFSTACQISGNAAAVRNQELKPFRFLESLQRGLRFSQVVPFLLCAFAARVWMEGPFGKICCSAASLLSQKGVERFSRLIGNSDTTAKGDGWQVTLLGER